MSDEHRTKIDTVRDVLVYIFVTCIIYVWWFVMLLLASLFLVNVWKISLIQIVKIAGVLTIPSGIGYIFLSTRKNLKKKWPR